MKNSNKNFQAFTIFKLSNLSKKLLALLTISFLSITTGACTSKNTTTQTQLDVSGIDKDKAFFVTPTGTKDKDCTTWENACDLQTAIDKANTDANKKFVLVAKGTYFADPEKKDGTKTFILKTGVKIYGGFDVSVEELKRYAQASILEGKLSDTLKTEQILKGENLSADTVLDGFVIRNALNIDSNAKGAGLYLDESFPKLTNLVFKNNNSSDYGGAIFNSSSNPSISNSTFSGNFTKYGGAIFNRENSRPSISNSTFSGNSAKYYGGAIYNRENSRPSISNSILWDNKDKHTGGESINNIYNFDTDSKPTIKNSILNKDSIAGNNTNIDTSTTSKNQTPATFVIESDGKVTDAASKDLIKNKGDNALYKATTGKEASNDKDLAGKPRLNGTKIDIGAYELQD